MSLIKTTNFDYRFQYSLEQNNKNKKIFSLKNWFPFFLVFKSVIIPKVVLFGLKLEKCKICSLISLDFEHVSFTILYTIYMHFVPFCNNLYKLCICILQYGWSIFWYGAMLVHNGVRIFLKSHSNHCKKDLGPISVLKSENSSMPSKYLFQML